MSAPPPAAATVDDSKPAGTVTLNVQGTKIVCTPVTLLIGDGRFFYQDPSGKVFDLDARNQKNLNIHLNGWIRDDSTIAGISSALDQVKPPSVTPPAAKKMKATSLDFTLAAFGNTSEKAIPLDDDDNDAKLHAVDPPTIDPPETPTATKIRTIPVWVDEALRLVPLDMANTIVSAQVPKLQQQVFLELSDRATLINRENPPHPLDIPPGILTDQFIGCYAGIVSKSRFQPKDLRNKILQHLPYWFVNAYGIPQDLAESMLASSGVTYNNVIGSNRLYR